MLCEDVFRQFSLSKEEPHSHVPAVQSDFMGPLPLRPLPNWDVAGLRTLAVHHQHKHTQTASCSAFNCGQPRVFSWCASPAASSALHCHNSGVVGGVGVCGGVVNAQAQRAHCAKVRMTDCCTTHTSAALRKPPWGGTVLNWALRCVYKGHPFMLW